MVHPLTQNAERSSGPRMVHPLTQIVARPQDGRPVTSAVGLVSERVRYDMPKTRRYPPVVTAQDAHSILAAHGIRLHIRTVQRWATAGRAGGFRSRSGRCLFRSGRLVRTFYTDGPDAYGRDAQPKG